VLGPQVPRPLAAERQLAPAGGSNSTTASTPMQPFLVPPKLTASIPAFHVISAGVHPSAAQALAKRAPSR
jgi:hypothetical protein